MKKYIIEEIPERIGELISKIENNKELSISYSAMLYHEEEDYCQYRRGVSFKNTYNPSCDHESMHKIHNIAKQHTELQPSFKSSKDDLIFYLKTKQKIYETLLQVDERYYDETLKMIENNFAEKQAKEKEERVSKFKEIAQKFLTFK